MLKDNPLVAFLIRSYLIGFLLAAVFTGLLLWFDVVGLWHLVTHVQGGFLAAALLWFFNGIVFAGAQAAVAVLLKAERDDDDFPGGGHGAHVPVPVPARHQPVRGRLHRG